MKCWPSRHTFSSLKSEKIESVIIECYTQWLPPHYKRFIFSSSSNILETREKQWETKGWQQGTDAAHSNSTRIKAQTCRKLPPLPRHPPLLPPPSPCQSFSKTVGVSTHQSHKNLKFLIFSFHTCARLGLVLVTKENRRIYLYIVT